MKLKMEVVIHLKDDVLQQGFDPHLFTEEWISQTDQDVHELMIHKRINGSIVVNAEVIKGG